MTVHLSRRRALQGMAALSGGSLFAPFVHANAPIRLGSVAQLEGVLAAGGQDAYRCIQMLLEEVNYTAAGRKIEWIRESSNGQPDHALARARKLIEQDQVDLLLGPLNGAEGIAVRDYSRTLVGKTVINGTSAAVDTTLRNPSPNFFRFTTDGAQWLAGLGNYVRKDLNVDEVCVVSSDYAFSYAQVFGFSVEYSRAGGKINYIWSPFGTSDYSSIIAQIPKTAKALVVSYAGSDGLAFLTQYAQAGGSLPLIGGTLLADQSLLSARGPHRRVMQGMVSAGPIADVNDDPQWKDFVARYKKRWGKDGGFQSPSAFGFTYYTNLQGTLLGLEKVRGDLSNGQKDFQAALAKVEFTNQMGAHVRLDHNRQAISDNFVNRIEERDGRGQTVVFSRVKGITQTLGIPEAKYLALGVPSRNNPGNNIQALL